MITILILYSNDRLAQFQNTLACLEEVRRYGDCEKVLCVDGRSNVRPAGFKVVEVARRGRFYNWARAMEAGIEAASGDVILYLDSDRIVPVDYLERVNDLITERSFVFPARLYSVRMSAGPATLKRLRNHPMLYRFLLGSDHRTLDPARTGKKNPLSGCVAFTKKTWLELGGFDPAFEGWGYPDYDLFMRAVRAGCRMLSVDCVELHQKHGYACNPREFELMNLWNLVKYHDKWDLPFGWGLRRAMQRTGLYDAESKKRVPYRDLEDFLERAPHST